MNVIGPLVLALAFSLAGCSRDAEPRPSPARGSGDVFADDIPVAHTPPGGYGLTFPEPVLARCTEPLAPGAPDLRGIWKTLRAERNGAPLPEGHPMWGYVERIEQCGDRIVDMGGGTIADARADGTARNGVHDVSVFDYQTPIHVVASYEDGVFVLRPILIPDPVHHFQGEGHALARRGRPHGLDAARHRPPGRRARADRWPDGRLHPPEHAGRRRGPEPGEALWRYRLRKVWAFLTA